MILALSRAKWLLPLIVIVAMLAAVGLVWSQSGSGDDGGAFGDVTNLNPVYDDQLVVPSEGGPIVLYSLAIDPPTSTVPMNSGTLATITLTNLIEAPLDNNTKIGGEVVTQNGDLTGDLLVTADVYNLLNPCDCIVSYDTETYWADNLTGYMYTAATGECYANSTDVTILINTMQSLYNVTLSEETAREIVAGNFAKTAYVPDGLPNKPGVVIKVYEDVTVHPGGTVTFQVPIMPGSFAIAGAEFMVKAVFNVTAGP